MVVWSTSLASLSVIVLVGLFMRNRPSDVGVLPYGAKDKSSEVENNSNINPFLSALNGLKIGVRSKDFWLLAGSFFVCGLSTNGLIELTLSLLVWSMEYQK